MYSSSGDMQFCKRNCFRLNLSVYSMVLFLVLLVAYILLDKDGSLEIVFSKRWSSSPRNASWMATRGRYLNWSRASTELEEDRTVSMDALISADQKTSSKTSLIDIETIFVDSGVVDTTTFTWNDNIQVHLPDRLGKFAITMTYEEYQISMKTFLVTIQAFEANTIDYMLYGGSLLGAYRHHGYIPWDDELDVIVNKSEEFRVKKALSDIPGFKLYTPKDRHWKIFNASINSMTHQWAHLFQWPFVDIFFFKENANYIWNEDETPYLMNKSDVFPLKNGLFQDLLVRLPCNPKSILDLIYNITQCKSPPYDHRMEKELHSDAVPCHQLHPYLPFVHRTVNKFGRSFETLHQGDRIIHLIEDSGYCGA